MPITSTRALVGALVLLAALGAPAHAIPPLAAPDGAGLAHPDPARLAAAIEEARPALMAGDLAAAVLAGARLGAPAATSEALRLADAAQAQIRRGASDPTPGSMSAPAALRDAVADLRRALAVAGGLSTRAVRLDDGQVADLTSRSYALLDRAMAMSGAGEARGSAALLAGAAAVQAELDAGVDKAGLTAAGLIVARAIDAALPHVRTAAADLPTRSATTAGCDVVDEPPTLCIAGTGANVISDDYALVIDLGGDDVHTHSAGGAAPTVNGLAAAVTIDVSGNDRYEGTKRTQFEALQGMGRTGGVGFLVDLAGDDRYTATGIPTGDPEFPSDLISAQGSAVAGVGVLADLAGDDHYRIENRVGGPTGNGAQGIGDAVAGLALALDRGQGADVATITGAPTSTFDEEGAPRVSTTRAGGFGQAIGGVAGIHADDGGADLRTVLAQPEPPAPGDAVELIDFSFAQGFGLGGLGGTGLSLTGPGGQQNRAHGRIVSSAPAPMSSAVFGYAALGGVGAAVDTGGDDLYDIDLRSTAVAESPAPAVEAETGVLVAGGMGHGVLAAVGLLRDLGGNDRYRAVAETAATAATTADPTGPSRTALAVPGSATANVMGSGLAAGGALEDVAGDDRYEVQALSSATASALGARPHDTVEGYPGPSLVLSLAAATGDFGGAVPATGELHDRVGRDVYLARAHGTGTSGDLPGTMIALGGVVLNGAAWFSDVDGGAADSITLEPARPACTGSRGTGVWVDCGQGSGGGFNG